MRQVLHDEYWEVYSDALIQLAEMQAYSKETIDLWIKNLIDALFEDAEVGAEAIYSSLPAYYMEQTELKNAISGERNVFIDPIRGRRIVFDTIHGVKGETHDVTLYLETDRQGASDLNRILPYYGAGSTGKSSLFDYSRKLAYVGFSRPRKLLCVAMQSETYERSKGAFDKDWEIIDLRN